MSMPAQISEELEKTLTEWSFGNEHPFSEDEINSLVEAIWDWLEANYELVRQH